MANRKITDPNVPHNAATSTAELPCGEIVFCTGGAIDVSSAQQKATTNMHSKSFAVEQL